MAAQLISLYAVQPENILLKEDSSTPQVMISDFGISKVFQDNARTATFCGTSYYIAPEIIRDQEYGVEVDMWSMGCLVYFL